MERKIIGLCSEFAEIHLGPRPSPSSPPFLSLSLSLSIYLFLSLPVIFLELLIVCIEPPEGTLNGA